MYLLCHICTRWSLQTVIDPIGLLYVLDVGSSIDTIHYTNRI